MQTVSSSELVGICDADQRPRRDCWRLLAEVFSDERVAAAAGYLEPISHDKSAVSRYAALETWVHQLVTAQAKDTLGLNPPTHGGAVYRRSALADIGGFVAGISGEDVTTSTALTEAGWTTRFVSGAVIENRVVAKWSDYWHQHVRWARGVFDTTSEHRRRSQAPLPRRLEGWLLTAGYLDRIGFSVRASCRGGTHRTGGCRRSMRRLPAPRCGSRLRAVRFRRGDATGTCSRWPSSFPSMSLRRVWLSSRISVDARTSGEVLGRQILDCARRLG